MSYEFYKIIHIAMAFILIAGITASFIGEGAPKSVKIGVGICSLLLFVAGMGLIARIGIGHGEGWPLWLKVKVGLWLFIAAGAPIAAKRMRNKLALGVFLLAFIVAMVSAVLKFG
jgi:uncharacterized membrane protein SirB2